MRVSYPRLSIPVQVDCLSQAGGCGGGGGFLSLSDARFTALVQVSCRAHNWLSPAVAALLPLVDMRRAVRQVPWDMISAAAAMVCFLSVCWCGAVLDHRDGTTRSRRLLMPPVLCLHRPVSDGSQRAAAWWSGCVWFRCHTPVLIAPAVLPALPPLLNSFWCPSRVCSIPVTAAAYSCNLSAAPATTIPVAAVSLACCIPPANMAICCFPFPAAAAPCNTTFRLMRPSIQCLRRGRVHFL